MSTADVFQRLGVEYLTVFHQENTASNIYPDKVTSQEHISDAEELLRWSELFPIELFDQFDMEHNNFAYTA